MDSLVSVIVPVYRVEEYLNDCVQSIVCQSYHNLEIILVDDGSPDCCPAMCDAWAEKDCRIKVIHKRNGGVSEARNTGLSAASGDYCVFIDSDDIISLTMIEQLLSYASEQSISLCSFQRFRDKVEEVNTGNYIEPEYFEINRLRRFVRLRNGLFCCGVLFPRKTIERDPTISFDANLGNLEDVVWLCRALTRIKKVVFISSPMYYYRSRSSSITGQCGDRRWQAESWVKARKSILQYRDMLKNRGALNRREAGILFQADIHCLKNFYSECVCGDLPLSDVLAISNESKIQAVFFTLLLKIRR